MNKKGHIISEYHYDYDELELVYQYMSIYIYKTNNCKNIYTLDKLIYLIENHQPICYEIFDNNIDHIFILRTTITINFIDALKNYKQILRKQKIEKIL